MTELDLEIPELALGLIDEYGADIQFGRITSGNYSPATGTAPPVGGLEPRKAVIGSGRTRTRSGGLVEGAELALFMAASALPGDPTPEDRANVNGTLYKVLETEPTYSGQLIALWTVWIGKL